MKNPYGELTKEQAELLVRVSKAFLTTLMTNYKWEVEPTMIFANKFFDNFRREMKKEIRGDDLLAIYKRVNKIK